MLYKMTLYKKLTIASVSATFGMTAVLLLSPPALANQQLMTEVDAQVAEDIQHESFSQWRDAFRRYAKDQGISEATLREAFDQVRYRERIIELDRYQPEFVRPIWEYLDTAVSSTRINNGQDRLAEHRRTAEQMEQRYGVPAEIIVAIWGIESNYGSNFGDFSTLEALATLAFDGRRQQFAREELLAALRIIQQGDIAAEQMRGSWAGAMGHTQFIPTSFEAYAVDGDGDNRRDIWQSIPDVMASTANYLDRAGWQPGQPWGVEVNLPADYDYAQTGRRDSQAWAEQGVEAVSGELPRFDSADVIVPAGADGPAFLVGPNFRAILRYNNATSYALAVATLSDAIAGRDGIQQGWPREEAPLTRDDVQALQRYLNQAGYDVGGADGIMGPNTRQGLRAFQRAEGLTPDGFATQSLLERLRQRVE
ncbi:lytic murein transglycosylase [Halomonas janggokensis]|uniref:Lytic murein transglycosylase n=1 Tax=Vreelandella janggokensis TaxID=370767 RepID=A0ABT4IQ45_9GAMM|nr:lytic murein transglycosylase [Halomonas janggokensis]MCZ0925796.1 lytic murein transglycosylase [Halomonas janggokensis]MCZ0930863.1 lytic murein transglycosylase [Halomonas janggokensis]